ncbi:MAG: asparagine--tRNA ligase [Planctomycetales bacterium]|jgi:asparaginyl-tRNA synthetase|nr:asparagine--tRNA ligase [Planctomycetales bacterium]
MPRTKVAQILRETLSGTEVDVRGWVRTKRESKQNFAFLEVNDGSCLANIQVVVDANVPDYAILIKQISTGASVAIIGEVKESLGKGQRVEIHARQLTVLGTSDALTYPLQKKGHSLEFLREKAHLRPRTNTFGAMARVRNSLCATIHDFFQTRGFLYVQTPIITTSDCEGAGQVFQVTTLDLAKLQQFKGPIDYSRDFFGKKAGLTVSGQLEGEIYATALGDVYTFGPTFRAENSNTTRHLAEFWMVEPEMPFYVLEENMDLAESFVRSIVKGVMDRCQADLEFFNERFEPTLLASLQNIVENEFIRLTYTEAIEILEKSGHSFEYPISWGNDMHSEHERYLTEQHFKQPVILTDYPREIKSFYMRCNEDGKTVRAMDVLVPRIGEIIGGSQREERHDALIDRMKECHLDPEDYWWYLELRQYGTVPHSGFGLGLERTVQLVTGMTNIRDCIPFPRTPKSAEF